MIPLGLSASPKQILRRLRHERGFTATVVLILGLCIGTNIAIFAVVDAILVRDLPFVEPDRLVTVINSYPQAGVERAGASIPNYYERRGAITAFSSLAIHQLGYATIGEVGAPMRVARDRVSPEFFVTLGAPLVMGRTFTEGEMFSKNSTRAILTDAFWRAHFNADPQIVGKTMTVDSFPVTIVGVLAPGFRYLGSRAEFFVPLASTPEDRAVAQRHSNNMGMIARLAPGATIAIAKAQIDALNSQQITEDPSANWLRNAGFRTNIYELHADHVRGIRPILLLLQGGVAFLLLIGGVNVVNLSLVRAAGRSRDFAVRQALGAGPGRITGEIVMETLMLAATGGLLGVGVGATGVYFLKLLGAAQLPLGAEIVFDARVALVLFSVTLVAGLVLAIPIVLVSLRSQPSEVLQSGSHGGTSSRSTQRVRHGFIVVQISLAFVLLTGALTSGLGLNRLLNTPSGFHAESVLTGTIALPWKGYPDDISRNAFVQRILVELRAQPGIIATGITNGLPMSGNISDTTTAVEGHRPNAEMKVRTHYVSAAAGEYWKVMGIPLIEGRLLTPSDNRESPKVCLVDKAFADRYWPGKSAIGHRISNRVAFEEKEARTIVGVVGNVKQRELAEPGSHGAVYFPYGQYADPRFSIVLRASVPPAALAPVLRKTVLQLDPALPVDEMKVMQMWVDDSLIVRRAPALLAGIFASVSLFLAAIGTYSVMAYAATQRRREIGIRLALGARPVQILSRFLRLGMQLLFAGVSVGILGALWVDRAMQNIWSDATPTQIGVLIPAAVMIVAAALVAILLPAHKASRISPLEVMRGE